MIGENVEHTKYRRKFRRSRNSAGNRLIYLCRASRFPTGMQYECDMRKHGFFWPAIWNLNSQCRASM